MINHQKIMTDKDIILELQKQVQELNKKMELLYELFICERCNSGPKIEYEENESCEECKKEYCKICSESCYRRRGEYGEYCERCKCCRDCCKKHRCKDIRHRTYCCDAGCGAP